MHKQYAQTVCTIFIGHKLSWQTAQASKLLGRRTCNLEHYFVCMMFWYTHNTLYVYNINHLIQLNQFKTIQQRKPPSYLRKPHACAVCTVHVQTSHQRSISMIVQSVCAFILRKMIDVSDPPFIAKAVYFQEKEHSYIHFYFYLWITLALCLLMKSSYNRVIAKFLYISISQMT